MIHRPVNGFINRQTSLRGSHLAELVGKIWPMSGGWKPNSFASIVSQVIPMAECKLQTMPQCPKSPKVGRFPAPLKTPGQSSKCSFRGDFHVNMIYQTTFNHCEVWAGHCQNGISTTISSAGKSSKFKVQTSKQTWLWVQQVSAGEHQYSLETDVNPSIWSHK